MGPCTLRGVLGRLTFLFIKVFCLIAKTEHTDPRKRLKYTEVLRIKKVSKSCHPETTGALMSSLRASVRVSPVGAHCVYFMSTDWGSHAPPLSSVPVRSLVRPPAAQAGLLGWFGLPLKSLDALFPQAHPLWGPHRSCSMVRCSYAGRTVWGLGLTKTQPYRWTPRKRWVH